MTSRRATNPQVQEFPMTAEKLLGEAAAVVRRKGDSLLVDLKVARLSHDPRPLNSITDIAGYAACLAEVLHDA